MKVSGALANMLISDGVKISLTSDGGMVLHMPLSIRANDKIYQIEWDIHGEIEMTKSVG